MHQEAPSAEADLRHLRHKVGCGAVIVITQLFYDNADFFRFRDRCQAAGIGVPIIPGLLPVLSLAQIQRITALCKARLPNDFVNRLGLHNDSDWQFQVGVEHATRQAKELLQAGVPGLHFMCSTSPTPPARSWTTCHSIRLKPDAQRHAPRAGA